MTNTNLTIEVSGYDGDSRLVRTAAEARAAARGMLAPYTGDGDRVAFEHFACETVATVLDERGEKTDAFASIEPAIG